MAASMANQTPQSQEEDGPHVLASNLGGGPLGLGDPEDRTLRKAEREILIPQKMKLKAKKELCATQMKVFGVCAKEQGLMMPFKCRAEAKEMEKCLASAYSDPAFVDQCTEEYLKERSIFRSTGIKAKAQKKDIVL